MEEKKIVILDPVSKPEAIKININPRPKDIAGLRIIMIDNTKPNFEAFLDRIEELLSVHDSRLFSLIT